MKGIAEIARDCLDLPVSQRLRLVRVLLDVSEPEMNDSCGVDEAWDDELGARMAAVKSGQARSQSVEEFLSKLEGRRPA
jgi:putative addiction module component (TIGR02574 family)